VKTVHVLAHQFDALPGHVSVSASGSGSSLRMAVKDAVDKILSDVKLRHKHIGEFKLSVVVIANGKETDET